MYCDSPLTTIHAIPGGSEYLDADTILIYPRGTAWARVDIPKEMRHYDLIAHTRSRWARVGLQVQPVDPMIAQPWGTLAVLLSNWSPTYSLVIRTGDTITLAPYQWTKLYLKLVEIIPFTAGGVLLRMKEAILPKRRSGPFFDPQETNIQECMETVPYDMLISKKHDFLVMSVCERPAILDGHIGFATSAVRALLQNSAQYDYAGSHGTRVMEFKVLRSIQITPGAQIGNLAVYATSAYLPPYQGILGKSESVMPFPWI